MQMIVVIGLGAGLASALLFFSGLVGSALAAPLYLISPLPLMIVGLGWHFLAALIGGAAATIGIAAFFPSLVGVVFLLAVAAPAVWLTRLLTLSRPLDESAPAGPREWYPLGRLLLQLAGIAALMAIAGSLLVGFNAEELGRFIALQLEAIARGADTPPETRISEQAMTFFARLIPAMMAVSWTLVLVFNLWLAARIVRKSERLARPWEDLARISVPQVGGLILLAAIAAAFALPAPVDMYAAAIAGAMAVLYFLQGLAVMHAVTRGSPARPMILATVYATTVLFSFPVLILTGLGLSEPFLHLRERIGKPPPPRGGSV